MLLQEQILSPREKKYDLAKSIMLEAGFDLQKWASSNSALKKSFT